MNLYIHSLWKSFCTVYEYAHFKSKYFSASENVRLSSLRWNFVSDYTGSISPFSILFCQYSSMLIWNESCLEMRWSCYFCLMLFQSFLSSTVNASYSPRCWINVILITFFLLPANRSWLQKANRWKFRSFGSIGAHPYKSKHLIHF